MAGRIVREDVETVRERARIEEVVSERVSLKPAGSGSMQGLCPFHDEKTPSFHIRPALGLWHCFGCGEGGDVISFVQKIDSLGFADAVEYLAGRFGVQLHYEEGGPSRPQQDPSQRRRLLEANRLAAGFFAEQLHSPEAIRGRQFLAERGFGPETAGHFGIGYAPAGWDNLLRHLRGRGFTEPELVASGLASQGSRGVYDRFRGRLIWPIRDLTGETVGFGARRLAEDDQGPKYLNTPETALYKKSQVLYGLDLAKKPIGTTRQVVIVEGYTDVMAMHLAGVTTAIATCGTAFGPDHIRIVRRLLGDAQDAASGVLLAGGAARGGEVIFTFDGDEAGRKAAMRAFAEDQRFYAQTFVAVAPDGMDPCELRQSQGDGALRDLVAGRRPLFRFAIESALANVDLNTAEGRVAGLRLAAPVIARIRDKALAAEYARQLSGWLGMDERTVRQAVSSAGRSRSDQAGDSRGAREPVRGAPDDGAPRASDGRRGPAAAGGRSDPVAMVERRVLEAALQFPGLVPPDFDDLDTAVFSVPSYRAVADAVKAAGGVAAGRDPAWLSTVREYAAGPVEGLVTELAVEPLPVAERGDAERGDPLSNYVRGVTAALLSVSVTRLIAEKRAQLQRLDPVQDADAQVRLIGELQDLEQRRRALREVNQES